jgi:hypothetical protein
VLVTRGSGVLNDNSTTATIAIYAAGNCLDCATQTNLFDVDESIRTLQDDLKNLSCLCLGDVSICRGPTEQEFLEEFSLSLTDMNYSLVDFKEKDPLLCTEELTSFRKLVTVEFESICSLFDDDTSILEESLVDTYNALSSEYYCDPYFRSLKTAVARTVGALADAGGIAIEFEVEGVCRGCDPDNVDIYDWTNPDERVMARLQSMGQPRQNSLNTCYCNADAIASRAPSEVEFIREYQKFVEESLDLLCISSIATCDFGSSFQTALVVAFEDEDSGLSEFEAALEAAFLSALNGLYANTEETCNPDFRVFQSVEAVFDIDFNPNDVFDRRMQESSWGRALQTGTETPSTSALPPLSPSTLPSDAPCSSRQLYLRLCHRIRLHSSRQLHLRYFRPYRRRMLQ